MKHSLCCAALAMTLASSALGATATAPFDYFVSLYRWQNTTNADGGWTGKVFLYLGNNALPNGAQQGPPYRVQFKVVDRIGNVVCNETWQETTGLPTGKTYAPYSFQIVYSKPLVITGSPVRDAVTKQYTITAAVYAEHPEGDVNGSNQAANGSFAFPGGGTLSCTRLPRPPFHQ